MVDINLFTIYLYRIKTLIMNTENNKIIAEFMGFEQYPIQNKSNGYIINFNDGNVPYKLCAGSLEFHSDWNWLMKVVEKIESIEIIDRAGRFNLGTENFDENYTSFIEDNGEYFIQCEGETKKEAVYNACVEFIKWYNQKTN